MAPKKNCITKLRPKKVHHIATQVTHGDLDETFELMCENPQTKFDIHRRNILKRKQQKYRNLFVRCSLAKLSSEVMRQQVHYNFGPQTIYKTADKLT